MLYIPRAVVKAPLKGKRILLYIFNAEKVQIASFHSVMYGQFVTTQGKLSDRYVIYIVFAEYNKYL